MNSAPPSLSESRSPGVEPNRPDAEVERDDATFPPPEFGGREGPEPTRYGDWEKNGRCIDF